MAEPGLFFLPSLFSFGIHFLSLVPVCVCACVRVCGALCVPRAAEGSGSSTYGQQQPA